MILDAIGLAFLLDHSVVRKGVVPLTSVVLPDTHKEQNFGCEDTPKRLKKLLEHRKASPSAFTESLNDFLQLGGTQNQNSQNASSCEGHGAPRPPKVSLRPKTGVPKVPNMQWGHIFGGENAFPSSLNEPRQVGGPQSQNSLHTNQDEGHDGPTTKKSEFWAKF